MSAPSAADTRRQVAIVGIGCRFPGGVVDPASFWKLLNEGVDAITEIPASRIDLGRYFDPRPATPGRMMSRWGGFLDRIEEFDPEFFGISPREAGYLDPQQRLLLETAWEALEDAGQDAQRLNGSPTSVFVGQWVSDFESRVFSDPEGVDFHATTGSGRYAASGRISYVLGLRGPSLTIDSACSSSLAAVHLAVRSIRSGESTLALAGGANIILQPQISIAYSQSRMMAPDGHCKFGDASGDGYVRSEGVALVALKLLDRAMADGDRIYAVIRGSAVNNDGRSSGVLGRPSQVGHEEMLRSAYDDAGVAPSRVGYVEAHGTGTRAGDPVEVCALGAVLASGRAQGERCLIGSVKTNIGHTEGAAGIAGLIKAALALHHHAIPASLHFVNPNPHIPWSALPFDVPTSTCAWPSSAGPRTAAVNSFGIAGTNAHVVLEQAPARAAVDAIEPVRRAALLVLSTRSDGALRSLALRHAELLEAADGPSLHEVCWAAATRRTALASRAAFVAESRAELASALRGFAAGEPAVAQGQVDVESATRPGLVFVFPGQGAQWVGMARELMASEPVFNLALQRCEAAARPWLGVSICEQLLASPASDTWRLDRIEVIQPVLVALAIAYAQLLRSFGIEPDAVVGHSMGEVGAAHAAGVLDLDQAMRIICRRSALMGRTSGRGAMAMVDLNLADAERRLAGRQALLSVAAQNSPRACVVSGDPAALQQWMAQLDAEGVFCRRVRVDVASHSPQMDGPAAELARELADLVPRQAAVPIHSTLLARPAEGREYDAAYWARNMREPVRFADCVTGLLDQGAICFVELGPHPMLSGAVLQTAQARGLAATAVACGRRDAPEQAALLGVVGALWVAGRAIDWSLVLPRGRMPVDLPLYPWQRERHWCDAAAQRTSAAGGLPDAARGARHPLLERFFQPAAQAAMCWESTLVPARFPYLADHRVRGSALFPAAAYCAAALAAAHESRGLRAWALRDVEFHSAWALPASVAPKLQLRLEWTSDTAGRFEIHGLAALDDGERWERRASGSVEAADLITPTPALPGPAASSAGRLSHDECYALLSSVGLEYGPAFRGLRELQLEGAHAAATVLLDAASLDPRAARYAVFPPLLDALLQLVAAAIAHPSDDDATPLPTRIGLLQLHGALPLDRAMHAVLTLAPGTADAVAGDVAIHDADGRALGVVQGVQFKRLSHAPTLSLDDLLHAPTWVAVPRPAAAPAALGPVLVIAAQAPAARPLIDALGAAGVPVSLMLAHELAEPQAALRIGALCEGTGARGHIVHLCALASPAAGDDADWIETAWQQVGDSTLALLAAIDASACRTAPRLWLVTQGAVSTDRDAGRPALAQAALWGLGRVWAHEQPALDLSLVDLDAGSPAALLPLLVALPAERQLALRGDWWLALRLPRMAMSDTDTDTDTDLEMPAAPSFKAAVATPGVPDTLQWQAAACPAPSAHEVEIEVAAAGLNFMNLLSALGTYPGYEIGQGPLGIECAGRVARVGAAVTQLAPGDDVIAIGPDCLGRHALVHGALVWRRPAALNAATAAGLPIAYLTAWYALHHQARLERAEKVLIHSAAGGVGLAALQIARALGAEVFATAGSDAKRAWLRSMGVAHVFDSRRLDFADEVLAASGGQGVDVVLNSLAGEAIAAGLRCLAPYGRFVELGKRDIYGGSAIALAPFRRNLAYFAVDLDGMMRERPERLGALLREVMQAVESGRCDSLPVRSYAADQLAQGFKDLMPGHHIGKHVIVLEPPPSRVHATPGWRARVRADGAYVISGGLGALGLEVAQWLARRGAGCVMLIGRAAPTAAAQAVLREMEAGGTRVLTAACDVADRDALAAVLERARHEGLPLRGVFHAAGVLADAPLNRLTPRTLRAPRDAKVLGAWHLDRLTAGDALDCFVVFSSVASLFGTPGQGNYAAANAFLDALAHDRRARGLHGLSVNLGPVASIGLATSTADGMRSLRRLGLDSLVAARVPEAIDRLMASDSTQAACMAFDATRWHAAMGHDGAISLIEPRAAAEGAAPGGSAARSLRVALVAVPAGPPRRALMEAALKAEVAAVLRMAAARVPADRPLKALGLDSLMALELRNRLERCSGLTLSPTVVWNHPSVNALGAHLAERLQVALDGPASAPASEPAAGEADLDALLDDLDQLSDEEARVLLAAEGGAA